jgi:V/A-type H+-transporting ATPase subunit E
MNDITNEKIAALQNIILEHANSQKEILASDARREAEAWLSREISKLDRETSAVIADAKARSEEIYRRQILSAEREKSSETLRLQNRLLSEAMRKFQDGLVRLREREDYPEILAALAVSSARSLGSEGPVKLKLAAADIGLGDKIAADVNARYPEIGMVFDHTSVPILGGCCVESADGKRQINADWQSRTQEVADTLAGRILALL